MVRLKPCEVGVHRIAFDNAEYGGAVRIHSMVPVERRHDLVDLVAPELNGSGGVVDPIEMILTFSCSRESWRLVGRKRTRDRDRVHRSRSLRLLGGVGVLPNDANQFGDVFLILLYIFLECGHRLCNGLNVAGGGSDGVSHSLHGGLHLLHLEG